MTDKERDDLLMDLQKRVLLLEAWRQRVVDVVNRVGEKSARYDEQKRRAAIKMADS